MTLIINTKRSIANVMQFVKCNLKCNSMTNKTIFEGKYRIMTKVFIALCGVYLVRLGPRAQRDIV